MNSVRDRAKCAGLPHSDILGSKVALTSPRLFAECHVLHRLSTPRHPPNALLTLESSNPCVSPSHDRSRAKADKENHLGSKFHSSFVVSNLACHQPTKRRRSGAQHGCVARQKPCEAKTTTAFVPAFPDLPAAQSRPRRSETSMTTFPSRNVIAFPQRFRVARLKVVRSKTVSRRTTEVAQSKTNPHLKACYLFTCPRTLKLLTNICRFIASRRY